MRVVIIESLPVFDAYYRVMDSTKPNNWNARRATEARRRLGQLNWILLRVQRREIDMAESRSQVDRTYDALDEVYLLTEAFYYFAWRARTVIRLFPGLKSFNPQGVHDVRNHLLEHPERHDSQVYSIGFAMGGEQGPVLGLRYDEDPQHWKGHGLYVDAKEFRDKLEPLLQPYLAKDAELHGYASIQTGTSKPPDISSKPKVRKVTAGLVIDIRAYLREHEHSRADDVAECQTRTDAMRKARDEAERNAIWQKSSNERLDRDERERLELAERFGGRIAYLVGEYERRGLIDGSEAIQLKSEGSSPHWIREVASELEGLAQRL